jgi:hypothetical protein
MEAIEELAQLSDSMRQASSLLADEDLDESSSSSSSSKRPSSFLNVVVLGNVVCPFLLIPIYAYMVMCVYDMMNGSLDPVIFSTKLVGDQFGEFFFLYRKCVYTVRNGSL